MSLDHLAILAASLTDARTRSMQRSWGWYVDARKVHTPGHFHELRHDLRFWSTLTPVQR